MAGNRELPTPGSLTRRSFLQQASLGAAALAWAPPGAFAAPARWKIIAFSKPFTQLNFDETADLVAEIGWDGIECPVRKASTHIQPERADDDLPKMVEALKKRGREVTMITTDITSVDASAERLLRTAAKLGIRKYRLGFIRYASSQPIAAQLADTTARLRDLAQLNTSIGVQGLIENHSGSDYFGGPIWDAYAAIEKLNPADLGIAFDIGHATIEGGLSWPLQARLMEPRYGVIYVKDFRWEKQGSAWTPAWCPLGQGMISPKFLGMLAQSSYAGPVCQHHEYDLGKTRAEMTGYFKNDLQTLREWLKQVGAGV